MGQAKRMWEEAMERGFAVDENIVVCPDCFDEEALRDFIRNSGGTTPCTYCGTVGEGTCTLEELLDHAMSCIRTEWGQPADEGLPYETREGGWQGAVIDSWELLGNVGLYALNGDLQEQINSALNDDEWCERDPFALRRDQTLYYGWKGFSKFVMHEARYVFLSATPKSYDEFQHDEMHPVKILDALAHMVEDIGLIDAINTTSKLYRVHIVDPKESLTTSKRLGSPPLDRAKYPNRMSPSGISMFYGAFDITNKVRSSERSERRSEPFVGRARDHGGAEGREKIAFRG
ncbi:HEPN-associated N-terminal domain-containing protein [Thiocapsa marina]|uniref:RES domain protein n=1 Tax=Thiocapsa marina 5811 TaxID=768671 RepID=F9UDC9_9GAMM|nr:HEPN-associated N-terminal domain-containing protein [Thiocapsa marina]EGV17873.1 RES domain protein [Thiocapsa marina 5811]